IPKLIEGLNRHLEGWKNYFDFGYPRQAFREINAYARDRVTQHLKRRSQRPFRPPEGVSFYRQIQRFGLVRLGSRATACACLRRYVFRESRMSGNLLVRFDEGRVGPPEKVSPSLLLYRLGLQPHNAAWSYR